MIEILVVRHGQSVADIEGRMEGRADFPLTDLGHTQAQKAAEWISKNYYPDTILSSPLKRASQTAQHIAEITGIKVEYYDELMEMDNGVVAGLLRSEADIKYPLPEGGFKPFDPRGITGESFIMLRARADTFLSKLLYNLDKSGSNKRICIVSHGNMISMLFRSFLNLPMDTSTFFCTGDTGMHLWRVLGCERVVVFMNCQEHLKL